MSYCAQCGSEVKDGSAFCSACGKPLAGAPVPAAKSSGTKFVILIVLGAFLLAAVPVVGIVAAIAIPNFLTAVDRAKQKRTIADLKTLGTVIAQYQIDYETYPRVSTLDELKPFLIPRYVHEFSSLDGWGKGVNYMCWQEDATGQDGAAAPACDHYALVSAGKDGNLESRDIREYSGGPTTNFNCDIVYVDGQLLQYPQELNK